MSLVRQRYPGVPSPALDHVFLEHGTQSLDLWHDIWAQVEKMRLEPTEARERAERDGPQSDAKVQTRLNEM